MPKRIAYLPLNTYPEAAPDPAILAAASLAATLGCGLQVSTFAVTVPSTVTASPLGGFFINVEGMARAAEERSVADCLRLRALVQGAAGPEMNVSVNSHKAMIGAAFDLAASEARNFDLVVLPWSADTISAQDMAQALVFEAGVPVILVPPQAKMTAITHIAIAWDGSRVAARALCDVLPLLPTGGQITVVTVQDEKPLGAPGVAQTLVAALERRGYAATAAEVGLEGRAIAAALQDSALACGAQLLAMGGFGHSRLRDFILGGATKGVFTDLRLPVLLAH